MTFQNQDLKKILKHYVKCQSQSEIEFIDDQRPSDITVADIVPQEQSDKTQDEDFIAQKLICTNISLDSLENKNNNERSVSCDSNFNLKVFNTVKSSSLNENDNNNNDINYKDFLVRDAKMAPMSSNSLPGRIHNSILRQNSDKENGNKSKKASRLKAWKPDFPWLKKSKKTDSSDTVEVAEVRVQTKKLQSPMSLSSDVPFKSFEIQPMKKKKMIPKFLRNMLSPSSTLPKSNLWSPKHRHNDPQNIDVRTNEYKTNVQKSADLTVADVVNDTATSCKTDKDFPEDVILKRLRTKSDNVSRTRVDTFISDLEPRRVSFPDKFCNCDNLRIDLITRALHCVAENKESSDVMKELGEFNKDTFHFENCRYNVAKSMNLTNSVGSSRHSHLSLYQSSEPSDNADDQLLPGISSHLLPLISKFEDGDEINFNDEHLNFFLEATTYDQFEDGMRQAIGFKCSVRNLAHLHYVTRKVVRHIGDPNKDDNAHIKRIMDFADMFCDKHFSPHIESHGSVEEFLTHCRHYDID